MNRTRDPPLATTFASLCDYRPPRCRSSFQSAVKKPQTTLLHNGNDTLPEQ